MSEDKNYLRLEIIRLLLDPYINRKCEEYQLNPDPLLKDLVIRAVNKKLSLQMRYYHYEENKKKT